MTFVDDRREQRFRTLFCDAYPDVLRFVRRRAPLEAEDVAAEVFLVAWRRLDDVPPRAGDARAWLFGVARGCLLNARRGEGRRAALAVRLADASPPSIGAAGHGQLDADDIARRLDLAAAWRRLSVEEQEVLALAAFDDLTSAEAGRVLGISAAAYRLRLLRARRALRRHLDPDPHPHLRLHLQEDPS